MLTILFTLCIFTNQTEGGWESISVNSREVNSVRNYLQQNIQFLFPEIENNEYIIESAKIQIVAGMNLQLNIKTLHSRLSFIITLYVNPQKKITIKNITHYHNTRPFLGGYVWHEVTPATNQTLQKLVQGTIIVYRTKIVRGLRTHIVFRDTEQDVYSTIFVSNPKTNLEELIYINRIE